MKIAYFYPHFARLAGTERVLIDKMNYLANQEGVEVLMVTYEQGSHPVAYPLSSKVNHIDLDIRFYQLYQCNTLIRLFKWHRYSKLLKRRFNQLMEDIQPEIVVATTYHGNILTLVNACPTSFVKVLESHIDKCYIHNKDPENKHNWRTWLRSIYDMNVLNREARKFDALVALHATDAEDWSHYLKAWAIPNIVHLNETGRYCDLDSKRVIFVGRLNYQKGIPDLIQIWKIVHTRHPDWRLDMYGDGDVRKIPATKEERMQMNIHVHTPDNAIFERYLESSLFVLTSFYESFGLVMPEAMSCGLPVVAFDCPTGPANIITDGVDGFLIRNRDIGLFADKLCSLMKSADLRHSMSKAAIKSSRRYSADLIMAQWMSLFKDLLASSHS